MSEITQERLDQIHAYWRAANYLGAAQLYLIGIAFVLHRIVYDQVGLFTIGFLHQRLNQFPKLPSGNLGLCQIIADRVMAYSLQVFSQVGARVVSRCTD